MSDICLNNEAYTVCSAFVPTRGLCWIFALRTRHIHCTVCRALVRSRGLCRILMLKERDIHSVKISFFGLEFILLV